MRLSRNYFNTIISLILTYSFAFGGYQFSNKSELQTAVDLWVSNESSALATYGDINTWDVSSVTNMQGLFQNKMQFNDNIGNWDVSNVTTMREMFRNAKSFNQDLNGWDVSKVTDMYGMFGSTDGNPGFNGNISNWDVSSVTTMQDMFRYATKFNKDISGWDVSSVTNMNHMFD